MHIFIFCWFAGRLCGSFFFVSLLSLSPIRSLRLWFSSARKMLVRESMSTKYKHTTANKINECRFSHVSNKSVLFSILFWNFFCFHLFIFLYFRFVAIRVQMIPILYEIMNLGILHTRNGSSSMYYVYKVYIVQCTWYKKDI